MRIAYRGNFQPDLPAEIEPWSTEHHIAGSLELLGHEVIRVQENTDDWASTAQACSNADLFLWTSTYSFAQLWPRVVAAQTVDELTKSLPTAGVHLDLWWGLDREHQVAEEPFFRLGTVFTADGDHDDEWRAAGVNHVWMPPAVYGPECVPGTPRDDWASDVAFIGSWESYGHAEWWPHRKAMLDAARAHFGDRLQCWPRPERGAVRGRNLNDLLASVKVVLGDSCMATTSRRYFSDRAFETVGRGGVLVHPYVEGLAWLLPEGEGVLYYPADDHAAMVETVEVFLDDDQFREEVRHAGQAHVGAFHTYERRMAEVLSIIENGTDR